MKSLGSLKREVRPWTAPPPRTPPPVRTLRPCKGAGLCLHSSPLLSTQIPVPLPAAESLVQSQRNARDPRSTAECAVRCTWYPGAPGRSPWVLWLFQDRRGKSVAVGPKRLLEWGAPASAAPTGAVRTKTLPAATPMAMAAVTVAGAARTPGLLQG
ncbi:uncharacterized protein LOC116534098 [Sapajus apella]|uniref:Uncharacterized protein LOC116534098 n=1 Tax=Sapajus apella TaxID=9515 RepID=A0A6J3FWS5_SAPAP|nr:uncharacterized protein LOC116534098 [Sapajus apella]